MRIRPKMKFYFKIFLYFLLYVVILAWLCEYVLYYILLVQCKWPSLSGTFDDTKNVVKVLILADTHMLGPRRGHWLDQMRREWQMHRAFQTSMTLFHPDAVFILGDIFDEGQFVDKDEFKNYVHRFHRLFYTPEDTKLIAIVGNHDIGFHYRMHPYFVYRFGQAFNTTGVNMFSLRNVHFVTINSIALEGDNCEICEEAEKELEDISRKFKCSQKLIKCPEHEQFKYSKPIILQHYPTYRASDETCLEKDSPKVEKFRAKWEVLSESATKLLADKLSPRLAFSGHSHHYCKIVNSLGIEEYTVASFNWRNKLNPSFILAKFTETDYKIEKCDMPREVTILVWYSIGILGVFILIIRKFRNSRIRSKRF